MKPEVKAKVLRRSLLAGLVLVAASNCALTEENRLWDLAETARSLDSPEMQAAIAAAQPGVPRVQTRTVQK
jgi:hypothetical protein